VAGNRQAWCYASGLVASRVGRLLDRPATVELLELSDSRELATRVRQTTLGADVPLERSWLEVGKRLDAIFIARAAEMGHDCPDSTVTDFFGLQEECRLLKRAVKARLRGSESGRLAEVGLERAEEVPTASAEEAEELSPWREALAGVDQLGSERGRPGARPYGTTAWLVDLLFDGALLRAERALADEVERQWGGEGLAQVIRSWVELQCLLVVARADRRPDSEGARSYKGGLPTVRQYFGRPTGEAEWLEALYQVDGAEEAQTRVAWREALESVLGGELTTEEETGAPAAEPLGVEEVKRVGRLGDQALMERVRAVRWVPFGPEPVFGYLWGLRVEADNLKAVVGGLQAGVSPDIIREQLRPTYV